MSGALTVPANTNSTRSAHFRATIGSGTTLVTWAVLSAIAFTIGAASEIPELMVLGPPALAVLIAGFLLYRADQQAEDEFFRRFAESNGLNHWAKWSLNEFTPLLAGGDRRRCEHWMEAQGRGLGWFTFEVREDNGDKPDTWEPHHFTIATVDVGEYGMRRFQGVFVRRRRGLFDRLDSDANWLRKRRVEKVELESAKFGETYELYRDPDQDEIVLHQLFSPSFIVWMAEHPLRPGFELRAGKLVVFLPGRCGEAGKLQFLLMAAAEIAKRIQAELNEAAQAGSL